MHDKIRCDEGTLRRFIERTLDAYFFADAKGHIVHANLAYCRMVGYTCDELRTMSIFDVEAARPLADIHGWIRETLEAGSTRFRTQHRRQDGMLLDVEVTATVWDDERSPPLLVVLVRDIGELVQTESTLESQMASLQVLMDLNQAVLWSLSPREIAQAALERITQLVPCARSSILLLDEERGQAHILAVHTTYPSRYGQPATLPLKMMRIQETLRQGQPYQRPDLSTLSPNEYLPLVQQLVEEGIRSILNIPLIVDGRLVGLLNLGATVSYAFTPEQVRVVQAVAVPLAIGLRDAWMREELRRYTERLESLVEERTRRLEELNAELEHFAHTVSHELEAPLRAVLGFAYALEEEAAEILAGEPRELLQHIIRAGEDMQQLIDDFLHYSHTVRAEVEMHQVEMAPIIADVLHTLEPQIEERGAHIEVVCDGVRVNGDERLLKQIVQNLIINALKFVPKERTPRVQVGCEQQGEHVRLWVRDNGIGIPTDAQERIFHLFQRLHGVESYPGTGVGLAVVAHAVARLGGRVWVESTPGQGSCFWVELSTSANERGEN